MRGERRKGPSVKKQSVKKQPARKQAAKNQPAKNQSAKNQSAKNQSAKNQSAKKPPGTKRSTVAKPSERLLILGEPPRAFAPHTRIGGVPLAPADLTWPTCARCRAPMQFHAQVVLDADASPQPGLLLLFVCANVATCPRWDPDQGANHARVVSMDELVPLRAPPGATTLGFTLGAREERVFVAVDPEADVYEEAREAWGGAAKQRQVLGRVGGAHEPIERPTPSCSCGAPMQFVAQVEEGPDTDRELNFAGGTLVAFVCPRCPGAAKAHFD